MPGRSEVVGLAVGMTEKNKKKQDKTTESLILAQDER